MKTIKLDASKRKTGMDFYDAILPALGAPEWHGQSVDALVRSMICGEINTLCPPFTVEVYATKGLVDDIMREIKWTEEGIERVRAYYKVTRGEDIQVEFTVLD